METIKALGLTISAISLRDFDSKLNSFLKLKKKTIPRKHFNPTASAIAPSLGHKAKFIYEVESIDGLFVRESMRY